MSSSLRGPAARRLAAELRRELAALTRLLPEADEALEALSPSGPAASSLTVRGCAGLLHDAYTGAEKLFELVATSIDGGLVQGPRWHRRLLDSMVCELPGLRPALLSAPTHRLLEEYLRFRHLFRHVYGYELDPQRLRPLLEQLRGAYEGLARDMGPLLELLDALAAPEDAPPE